MKRVIKFRGWHTKAQKMFSAEEMAADQLTLLPTGEFINVHSVSTALSVVYPADKFIPMQFTGIRDSNGNEIFESDVLDGHSDGLVKVVWRDTGWKCHFSDGGSIGLGEMCLWGGNNATVIGNIYKNPELLEAKQ